MKSMSLFQKKKVYMCPVSIRIFSVDSVENSNHIGSGSLLAPMSESSGVGLPSGMAQCWVPHSVTGTQVALAPHLSALLTVHSQTGSP